MKAVIQRVKKASVCIGETVAGEIGSGLLVLLGVMNGDTEREAATLAAKISKLRIFTDENDKMNLSVNDIGAAVLTVSQFTLCADVKKGNRPSFTPSAPPDEAERLYEYFMQCLKNEGVKASQHGVFGADMLVSLENDGPVTIIFDTDIWQNSK